MEIELPQGFVNMIASLGAPVAGLVESIATTAPEVSVRANAGKWSGGVPADAESAVPWCPRAWYMSERPQFTLDPLFHAGCYYVQDASSMFISHVIRQLTADADGPLTYLDACAAPGGKTTAAIDALPDGSMVVANEYDYKRAAILRENIIKWGHPEVMVTRGDTSRLADAKIQFDIVATDVPCSGEGMMRKDAKAVSQWSPGLINECTARQRLILDNLIPAIKPGGYLIYSTCTYNVHENEEILAYLADHHGMCSVEIATDPSWGITRELTGRHAAYRFMPHRTRGEGLFIAVMQRPSDAPTRHPGKAKGAKAAKGQLPDVSAIITATPRYALSCDGTTVHATAARYEALRKAIHGSCDVILDGVEVGLIKGRDIIPAHHAAMCPTLLSPSVPRVELSPDDARDYLRREGVTIPDDTPRGYVIVTHQGHPLGWLKNLGNRANNLYPADYRIRTL